MISMWKFFLTESLILAVILLNAVALLLLGFTTPATSMGKILLWVEYGCVVFYVLEAGVKIKHLSFRGYWANGWNRFDLLVTLCSLPVLMTPFLRIQDVRVVTLLRLGRLFRLFRLLHIIPNRVHLVKGIKRAFRASLGVLFALFLVNFVLALGATFLFREKAPADFGNPLLSFYTLFKVFTLEGWHDIPDRMIAGTEGLWWSVGVRLFFMVTVLGCGIFGFSIANAVFVDEMVMDNTDPLERKMDRLLDEVSALRELMEARHDASG